MRAATELTAELGERFKVGDAAPELVTRLTALVATLELQLTRTENLPDDLCAAVAELQQLLQKTTATGGRWLDAVADGPELASYWMRARVQKVYGLLIRDESPP
ncbi:hypothetical protein GobsT_47890 [Gemmata obscuriglobus]|uniref:Uncharacterized protein n=1 Tax=Gemmata obscuriglobus TaxID=114 RepID=A0A2Z3H0I9_9BACT|nr:hypothetical protein [Gemmata obscuriglobus]AWM37267.1 hypothetical protein C1280_09670 [Gemmata obscuriglobus]QEG29990.1 hypothetical protein GobsT_47890 [Gemmata obscuriglobus]VTS09308.1 unnamed protein product [Gemmata obscuriglobus UQM 2246]